MKYTYASLYPIIVLAIAILLFSCGTKELLPTVSEDEQADTSYIQIIPNWEQDIYGFASPKDILVGADGYLFVADSGNSRILVLDQAGNIISEDEYGNDFTNLENLELPGIGTVEPLRLTQDSKMNLLFVNGNHQVYAWNQYFNNIGIDSVASSITLWHSETNDMFVLNNVDSLSYFAAEGYSVFEIKFTKDEDVIGEILAPHVFYDGADIINILEDIFADPRSSRIIDIAAYGQDFGNILYMLDRRYNRIIRAQYYIKQLLLLSNGLISIDYGCRFSDVVTGQGYGAGFVMNPKSLSLDISGNIYFTQTGGNFVCHGISSGSYRTLFDPEIDDILEIGRFGIAQDISVDSRSTIYVVDADRDFIQTFNSNGAFIRNIGTMLIDGEETAYILKRPEAVAINNNIIYIADTGNSRIVRFQYVILAEQTTPNPDNQ